MPKRAAHEGAGDCSSSDKAPKTYTVIAQAIVRGGVRAVEQDMNPNDLNRGIDIEEKEVIEDVQKFNHK